MIGDDLAFIDILLNGTEFFFGVNSVNPLSEFDQGWGNIQMTLFLDELANGINTPLTPDVPNPDEIIYEYVQERVCTNKYGARTADILCSDSNYCLAEHASTPECSQAPFALVIVKECYRVDREGGPVEKHFCEDQIAANASNH